MATPTNRGITGKLDFDHKRDHGGVATTDLPGDATGNYFNEAGHNIITDASHGTDNVNTVGSPEGWDCYSSKKGGKS